MALRLFYATCVGACAAAAYSTAVCGTAGGCSCRSRGAPPFLARSVSAPSSQPLMHRADVATQRLLHQRQELFLAAVHAHPPARQGPPAAADNGGSGRRDLHRRQLQRLVRGFVRNLRPQ